MAAAPATSTGNQYRRPSVSQGNGAAGRAWRH
jgi:hypothetical protein